MVLDRLGGLLFFLTEVLVTCVAAIVGNYLLINYSSNPTFWVMPLLVRRRRRGPPSPLLAHPRSQLLRCAVCPPSVRCGPVGAVAQVIIILAYGIASTFTDVMRMASTTIFVCFCTYSPR